MTSAPQGGPVGRDDGLLGRVALITGGASGIGQALAVAYARAGCRSVVGYFPGDPHDVGETVRQVERAGGACVPFSVDVRDAVNVDAFAAQALESFGRLDIAVAGAGILRRAPLEEMTDDAWHAMLDVDLTGVLRTFRSAVPHLSDGGAMVAISSIAGGWYGWEDHAHYAAAKSGVLGLCRSMATELAPRGIRVNAMIPGLIETPQSLDEVNSLGPAACGRRGRGSPGAGSGTRTRRPGPSAS